MRKRPDKRFQRLLAFKWVPDVMVLLDKEKKCSFNRIKEGVGNKNSKIVALTLRTMIETGVVSRTVVKKKPLRTEYALTGAGEDLLTWLNRLNAWEQKWFAASDDDW